MARYHKELDVWKAAMELAAGVYRITELFPKHELYGLVSQMRRAAVSIASNIAEGSARQTNKEFVQFMYVALGSAAELDTQLDLAVMLQYIDKENVDPLYDLRTRVAQMLYGLIRSKRR